MYVKSISYDQHQIIKWILQLHCEGDIELDPTYSTGKFYKNGIKEPIYKFDIHPQKPGVTEAMAEALPLKDDSIKTMIFDPPFLSTTGPSLSNKKDGQNEMVNRFGCYPTEKELFIFYKKALTEFKRIIIPNGILIIKCQDKISSGKQYISHNFIINYAEKLGFYTKDLFILLAKNRLTPQWQIDGQRNARKHHSYFIVFQKKIVNLGIEKY